MNVELMQRHAQVQRELAEVRRAMAARGFPTAEESTRYPVLCVFGALLLAGAVGYGLWLAAAASSAGDATLAAGALLASAAAGYGSYRLGRLGLPLALAPVNGGQQLQLREGALMYELGWIESGNARLGPTGYAEPIDPAEMEPARRYRGRRGRW